MRECLLCKRDMKTAKTIFGNGCINSIYKLLNLEMPKKVKDREQYLYKNIMKKVNAKNLNSNQKVWLTDRYLTFQYLDNLKYGDYTELKNELKNDIANISKIINFSELQTANKVQLKQAYSLFKKEIKFDGFINNISNAQDTLKVGYKFLFESSPIKLVIGNKTSPLEIGAIKGMQYALWKIVAVGGNAVGFDGSSDLLEHSLMLEPENLVIREGRIVEEIKNDAQFKEKINKIVEKYGKDNEEFDLVDGEDTNIQFDNNDLYYSIHGASIYVKGKKVNEKWNLSIKIVDIYDYTKLKGIREYYKDANSVPKSMFSSLIYNLAFFSEIFGVIKEYCVNIEFDINEYEVD